MAVLFVVAGVHNKKNKLKRHIAVLLKLLHQLCAKHGILAAGNANGDFVVFLDKLVFFNGKNKGIPYFLAKSFYYASLYELLLAQFSCH